MIRHLLALTAALGGTVFAAEVVVQGMIVPQFDQAGRMVRRLNAESAVGGLTEKPRLKNAFVEFFSAADASPERIATLDFQDGVYDRARQTVTGAGHVVLRSRKGDVAGDGFEYDLVRNRLVLKSSVGIDVEGVHAAGNEAEVFLSQTSNQEALITKAVVRSGVVVTGSGNPKIDFDRAATESATYTAANETVVLASPVDVWKDGKRISTAGSEIKIYVGRARTAAPASEYKTSSSVEKAH
ncbi:MAG TPA: hypothetical protein VHO24_09610 [Opitutaceae bacterium]|nr:hypothetical protein [Opitutaceae bacterium]